MQQTKNKSISVVTVTYNSSSRILNLLKSIEKSDNPSLIKEIIIIENNSPDKKITKNNILNFKKHSKLNIKFYLSSKNNGFGKSCNYGARKAKSEYILFINPDTEVYSRSISTLLKHTLIVDADLSGGKSITFDGKRHYTVIRQPNLIIGLFEFSNLGKIFHTQVGHNQFYYLDREDILSDQVDTIVDGIGGAYLLVKKTSFQLLKGFDEKFFMYLEDVDLSIRAKELKLKIIYCPHSVIKHIGGASSTNKYKIRHNAWFESRKYYFIKHHNIVINAVIQPLYIIEEAILRRLNHL